MAVCLPVTEPNDFYIWVPVQRIHQRFDSLRPNLNLVSQNLIEGSPPPGGSSFLFLLNPFNRTFSLFRSIPPGHPGSTVGRFAGLACTIPAGGLPPS